ncbi:MAG: hypothetical protein ACI88A_000571 [Paraglaciecola sp.]|jgi:hypothetical protein
MNIEKSNNSAVSGEFTTLGGERFYAIHNVDRMAPFFVSVISDSDHWLFVSSKGGLTAGRVSPETALFPYITVDNIHESDTHTGSKTLVRVNHNGRQREWEPFNMEHDGRYKINRHIYKNLLGNKLCFEEINHDLQLAFRYTWVTSDRFGFARQCELQNLAEHSTSVDLIDGLQNILPAGTPRFTQTNSSNLVDAYKWSELDEQTGLAFFTLYSGITDRAEPCESLKANTVFCLGLKRPKVLISSEQLDNFRLGKSIHQENHKRGIRGAYMVNVTLELEPLGQQDWQLVANTEQTQSQSAALRRQLGKPTEVAEAISQSVAQGCNELARIMAGGDGFQATAEENVSVHHYANVLFNILRGGAFNDQYYITGEDFADTIKLFNHAVYKRHQKMFADLPEKLNFMQLQLLVEQQNDQQLQRLSSEYLPIIFGRRHGDPSRPWNQFAIKLKDENGKRLQTYQGNWRDIFQNWEALTFSYPEFIESVIGKFVNASTMDGYNPYRVTKEGFDWEVEEPDDPWSYIGYWGDHQIIYLQKMLELSGQFHPERLDQLLHKPIFCYANVPYKIKPFEALLKNAKATVEYDQELADKIEQRVASMGGDGKLVLDANGEVYQVNLLEKLLVPLLSKLGNLVVDGGIWLNTQRPEWNDANNALVGQGLSMVTLYYMRRYVKFLQQLLSSTLPSTTLSSEVARWAAETALALHNVRQLLGARPLSEVQRYQTLLELGSAASRYRETVYLQNSFSGTVEQSVDQLATMLDDALAAIDHSIATNLRNDGLYNAYNLLDVKAKSLSVDTLYPMLEGQVAALSAGVIAPQEAVTVLENLFNSDLYRADQHTFILYPDRKLPGFLEKNLVPAKQVEASSLLQQMLANGDTRVILRDVDGQYRFNAEFTNVGDLNQQLDVLASEYAQELVSGRGALQAMYEQVFNHQEFTGRSGGMFGFEGLGCVYWHMVAKLLLAVNENFFAAIEQQADVATCQRLGRLYYRVREGIGFNKTPTEFGAFPCDPYSHTPKHAGAQQPGMTGQVKEEVLARFAELGIRVRDGAVRFQPNLLRAQEFVTVSQKFRYLDVDGDWQEISVPASGLAFTWSQVPIVYCLDDAAEPSLTITWDDGKQQTLAQLKLSVEQSSELFVRSGRIRQLNLVLTSKLLFKA